MNDYVYAGKTANAALSSSVGLLYTIKHIAIC